MPTNPDVLARIYLYRTEDGGRTQPLTPPWYGCPTLIEEVTDSYHDCRILLEDIGTIFPGQKAVVPIAFLCPELFADKIVVGRKFKLWERRFIGEGEILEVYSQEKQ